MNYYLPIMGLITLFFVAYRIISFRSAVSLLIFIPVVVGTFGTFWLFGGFTNMGLSGAAAKQEGRVLNANLNSLINPMETERYLTGHSTLLPSLALDHSDQYEGYAYLGAGLILIFIIAIVVSVIARRKRGCFTLLQKTSIALCVATLLLAAAGTSITFNGHLLAEIDYPDFIDTILSIFRSNGRFMWGVWDIVAVITLSLIALYTSQAFGLTIVLLCAALQMFDLSEYYISLHNRFFARQQEYQALCNVSSVDELLSNKSHLMIMNSGFNLRLFYYYDLGEAVLQNGADINDYYYSRRDSDDIEAYKQEVQKAVDSGEFKHDTLYVYTSFSGKDKLVDYANFYYVDGLLFATTSNPDIDELDNCPGRIASISSAEMDDISQSPNAYTAVELQAADEIEQGVRDQLNELGLNSVYEGNTFFTGLYQTEQSLPQLENIIDIAEQNGFSISLYRVEIEN